MKIIIEKQGNKLGDEYLEEANIEAEIYSEDDSVYLEVDGNMYIIPMDVFRGIF